MLMGPALQLLVGVLDHHHGRVDHGPDGDGDAAQRHDVGVDALALHDQEGGQHPQRQGEDRHQGRAQVAQEQGADQGHDQELLQQLAGQVMDGPVDQARAVIGGDDLDAGRQALLQLGQLGLHRRDGRAGVLAGAQDHHAAGDLALAVEFGDAAPHFRADLDRGHVAEAHWDAAGRRLQRHGLEVLDRLQIAGGADHVFGLAQLQHRAAGLGVGAFQRGDNLLVRDPQAGQLLRVEHHLVLADHAADRRDLGHAR